MEKDGISEGSPVGISDAVGGTDGTFDGNIVELGKTESFNDGSSDGKLDGSEVVGSADGRCEGSDDGNSEGSNEGFEDGSRLGDNEGISDNI